MQVNSEFTDVPVLHPHSHRFASMADAKLFATAGNATITLESIKTGVHYTYKVRESKAVENSTKAPVHFVSLLTGPDNENDFKYLGLIVPNRYLLTITKASKLSTGSAPVLAFNYFWSRPDGAILRSWPFTTLADVGAATEHSQPRNPSHAELGQIALN